MEYLYFAGSILAFFLGCYIVARLIAVAWHKTKTEYERDAEDELHHHDRPHHED